VVPKFSASFSAWSMFTLDVGRDYLRSYPILLKDASCATINALFDEMLEEARKELPLLGNSPSAIVTERSADIRYKGQYHELELDLPASAIVPRDLEGLASRFHAAHKRAFTFDLPRVPIFLRNLRLIGKVPSKKFQVEAIAAGTDDASGALKRRRACYFAGQWYDTQIYDDQRLAAGNVLFGPALIEEPTTTVVVPPGFRCTVDRFGNYVIAQ